MSCFVKEMYKLFKIKRLGDFVGSECQKKSLCHVQELTAL